MTVKVSIGQNRSFICSKVDSLTPENGAIHKGSPSQSYKKCKSVPKSDVKEKPNSCHIPTDRFIKTSQMLIYKLYSSDGVFILMPMEV